MERRTVRGDDCSSGARFDTQCTLTVVSDGTGGRGTPISSRIDKVEDEDDGGGSDR